MTAYRFELPDDVYDRPENATSETDCYTRPGNTPLAPGLTDLAPCYYGKGAQKLESEKLEKCVFSPSFTTTMSALLFADFPVAASMPHFYSSPHLIELVGGLQPDRSKHHSYVIVEPVRPPRRQSCTRVLFDTAIISESLVPADDWRADERGGAQPVQPHHTRRERHPQGGALLQPGHPHVLGRVCKYTPRAPRAPNG